MDSRVLQLVFLFIIKNDAILLNVGYNRSFPARALQESYQAVEDPILQHKMRWVKQDEGLNGDFVGR